jgi:outer membrane lipoprotein-sorting protein
MPRKSAIIGLSALSLLLALGTSDLAAKNAGKAAKGEHQSIPQMMRAYGFKHKTANWISVSSTKDDAGKTTTSESKMWISGDKYRMETKDQQNGKRMVMIDDGQGMIMYQPDEKKAFRWGSAAESMFGSIMNSDVVAESARQRKTAKKVGGETVEGKPCDIYTYHSKLTVMGSVVQSEVKEWLWSAEKFTIKTVVNTPKHQMKIMFMTTDVPASETTTVIKDLVLDKPVDDSLFTVPADVKIEEMQAPPTMGGQGRGESPQASGGSEETPAQGGESEESGSSQGDSGNKQQPPVDVNKMLKSFF